MSPISIRNLMTYACHCFICFMSLFDHDVHHNIACGNTLYFLKYLCRVWAPLWVPGFALAPLDCSKYSGHFYASFITTCRVAMKGPWEESENLTNFWTNVRLAMWWVRLVRESFVCNNLLCLTATPCFSEPLSSLSILRWFWVLVFVLVPE